MILFWVQQRLKDYPIPMTNFSTCWNDGLAFCAIIHCFYPEAFDWYALDAANRKYNFTFAFEKAEELAGIYPLLEVDDMVRFKKPDWKCVFTYVQSFYRRFRDGRSPPKATGSLTYKMSEVALAVMEQAKDSSKEKKVEKPAVVAPPKSPQKPRPSPLNIRKDVPSANSSPSTASPFGDKVSSSSPNFNKVNRSPSPSWKRTPPSTAGSDSIKSPPWVKQQKSVESPSSPCSVGSPRFKSFKSMSPGPSTASSSPLTILTPAVVLTPPPDNSLSKNFFHSKDAAELEKRQQEKAKRKEEDQITKEEKVTSNNRPPIPKCSPPELKSIN